jgi:ribose-phosphate pyrophosphokinase
MLAADACRRGGARHVTAVVPYVGYARQDRRGLAPASFGARVMADIVGAGSVDRLVTVDLHNSAIEGFFAVPVEHLTAVPILAGALGSRVVADHAVVVAPDLGAVKLAQRYGRILGLPVAIVQKQRLSGSAVAADSVAGDVSGRVPVIVDDMLSTGATIAGACRVLAAAGAASGAGVVVTHGLFTGNAEAVLKNLSLGFLMTSDSVAAGPPGLDVTVQSLGPLLAEAIRRMHSGGPLADVYAAVRTSARAAPRSD